MDQKKTSNNTGAGVGIALGAGVGASLGLILFDDNLALSAGIGVALGSSLAPFQITRTPIRRFRDVGFEIVCNDPVYESFA